MQILVNKFIIQRLSLSANYALVVVLPLILYQVDVPILRLAAIREQEETPPSPPKRGRKRRRQLLFVDLKTQLSKTEIRSSMEDFEKTIERDVSYFNNTCVKFKSMLVPLSSLILSCILLKNNV